jgi:hypothetical protein
MKSRRTIILALAVGLSLGLVGTHYTIVRAALRSFLATQEESAVAFFSGKGGIFRGRGATGSTMTVTLGRRPDQPLPERSILDANGQQNTTGFSGKGGSFRGRGVTNSW